RGCFFVSVMLSLLEEPMGSLIRAYSFALTAQSWVGYFGVSGMLRSPLLLSLAVFGSVGVLLRYPGNDQGGRCRPPCFHLFSSFLTCGGNPARNRAACQRRCCVVEVCSSEDQRKTRPSEWLDARYLPSGLKATRELYASPTRE